jgi:SAM-dependent methyltransferase
MNIRKRTTCRLCDSKKVTLVCPLKPTPIAEKYRTTREEALSIPAVSLDLYRCEDCGHVQILDLVDSSYLFDADYTYRSGQTKGIIEHFQQYAESAWNRLGLKSGDLVVEVGSNDGTLLNEFKMRGARVIGVDPASTIALEANERGVETITGFFTPEVAVQIAEKHGKAKLVVANNVFAHADDLQSIAYGISQVIAEDGVFMFEVSYVKDVLDHCLLGTIFHEHFSYHAVKPMQQFLRRYGLDLFHVERNSIQGGSIIMSARAAGAAFAEDASLTDILALEENAGLNTQSSLNDFAAKLHKLETETIEFVRRVKAEGKTIAGFGAARSGTTLIAQLEIGDAIDCIFDDHPDKAGKYSAGFGIPVYKTSEILTRKPDYIIILAWVFAKKIMASNEAYTASGGRWVTCVPELQITPA